MNLSRNIEECDLAFLDLETTGLDVVTGDAICEIGALKVRDGKVVAKFHSLVNPGRSVPEAAYLVHKISDADLAGAPVFAELADGLLGFLQNSVICAYNAKFDIGFIDYQLKQSGREPLDLPAVDILLMARDMLRLPRYNLQSTARHFGIDCACGLHRALADAELAYRIFFKLRDIFKDKKLNSLADFFSLYGVVNDIFNRLKERKIQALKEAIENRKKLKLRYFSAANNIEEAFVRPLQILREGRRHQLCYQGDCGTNFRLQLNRIFSVEPEIK